jgi:hypothetical protein
MVRMRPRLAGVIEPCLPSPADRAPQEILADTEQVQSKTNGLGVASGEEWFAQGHVTGGGKPSTAVQKMLRGG